MYGLTYGVKMVLDKEPMEIKRVSCWTSTFRRWVFLDQSEHEEQPEPPNAQKEFYSEIKVWFQKDSWSLIHKEKTVYFVLSFCFLYKKANKDSECVWCIIFLNKSRGRESSLLVTTLLMNMATFQKWEQ